MLLKDENCIPVTQDEYDAWEAEELVRDPGGPGSATYEVKR